MSSEAVDVPGFDGDVVAPRARGRPARISRERIIAAARTIAPEALTMQKVADVLGVDPKALNYHVRDRDGLRQLVVLDVFESELRRVKIPGGGDWRNVGWLTSEVTRQTAVAGRSRYAEPAASRGDAQP